MTPARSQTNFPASRDEMTVMQKIMVAMLKAGFGQSRCTEYGDIVMEAWRLFPDDFALKGYQEHPDASNIHKSLYSALKNAGLAESCKDKRFRLTKEGLLQARELLDVAFPEKLEKP